jgi:hypothetical protein
MSSSAKRPGGGSNRRPSRTRTITKDTKEQLLCNICKNGKIFTSGGALREHMRRIHGSTPIRGRGAARPQGSGRPVNIAPAPGYQPAPTPAPGYQLAPTPAPGSGRGRRQPSSSRQAAGAFAADAASRHATSLHRQPAHHALPAPPAPPAPPPGALTRQPSHHHTQAARPADMGRLTHREASAADILAGMSGGGGSRRPAPPTPPAPPAPPARQARQARQAPPARRARDPHS